MNRLDQDSTNPLISRRKLLVSMGAAGAVAASAGLLAFAEESNPEEGAASRGVKQSLGVLEDELDVLTRSVGVSIESFPRTASETDDTGRIQRAIQHVDSLGGGVVRFSTGTYWISASITESSNRVTLQGQNNAGTIIKAIAPMDNMFSIANVQRIYLRDLQINGDNQAQVGLYTHHVGQLWIDNVVVQKCLDKGIFMDNGTWMFHLNNVYVIHNQNFGIYIGNDCAGSVMNMVVAEENGINMRIGATRMIQINASTFQRYTKEGNVLIQAGWDITFDTCWFEPTINPALAGETYDLKMIPRLDQNGFTYVGRNIRLLNNSFHGSWGDTGAKSKYCILDQYSDTVLENNGIDATNGGYTSGTWYVNSSASPRVIGMNNQVMGSVTQTLSAYAMWHIFAGTPDDLMVKFEHAHIRQKLTIREHSDIPFDYNGRLYHSEQRKRLKFASDEKWWDVMQAVYASAPPASGNWRKDQLVLNQNPEEGQPLGWVCVETRQPWPVGAFGLIGEHRLVLKSPNGTRYSLTVADDGSVQSQELV